MSASLSFLVGTPKRSAGVPGEGDFQRTELTEGPPHPASGAREERATA